MYTADEPENPADTPVFPDALVLPDYDPSQAPTAAERIARAAARNRPDLVVCHCTHSDLDEQARRQLDLISARVLNTPQAAATLSRLGITDHVEPAGAVVFACLLHLAGRDHGAEFWWKFAAGSGNPTAAQCLALQHESNANHPDAHYWRDEAQRLFAEQGESEPEPGPAASSPLLPEHVARQLLDQCQRGLQPQLPDNLKAAINELVIEYDDGNLAKIPSPRPRERPDGIGAHR